MQIQVNDHTIGHDEIAREATAGDTTKPQAERMAEAKRALAVRELLLQEADRQGIVADPQPMGEALREGETEAKIRQLLERAISVPKADEAACRRYFENNRARFDRLAASDAGSFESMHEAIAAYLEERAWRRAVAQYIALLAGGAEIRGVRMDGARSPLVR